MPSMSVRSHLGQRERLSWSLHQTVPWLDGRGMLYEGRRLPIRQAALVTPLQRNALQFPYECPAVSKLDPAAYHSSIAQQDRCNCTSLVDQSQLGQMTAIGSHEQYHDITLPLKECAPAHAAPWQEQHSISNSLAMVQHQERTASFERVEVECKRL